VVDRNTRVHDVKKKMTTAFPQTLHLSSFHAKKESNSYFWTIDDGYFATWDSFSVQIIRASIPNEVYPVNAYNRFLYLQENGNPTQTFTLPVGNYNSIEITTMLASELTTQSGQGLTYTVTFDDATNTLTFNVGLGNTISFRDGAYNMNRYIGFLDVSIPTTAAQTVTGTMPVQLQGTKFLHITSGFSIRSYSSTNMGNVLLMLPLVAGFGSVIPYEAFLLEPIECQSASLHRVSLSFWDDRGNPWVLPDNADISVSLRLYPR
jgi:hypothetical protein